MFVVVAADSVNSSWQYDSCSSSTDSSNTVVAQLLLSPSCCSCSSYMGVTWLL